MRVRITLLVSIQNRDPEPLGHGLASVKKPATWCFSHIETGPEASSFAVFPTESTAFIACNGSM